MNETPTRTAVGAAEPAPNLLVSGPPVSGRTTALLHAAVDWIALHGRPARQVWWIPTSSRARYRNRQTLTAHRTLQTVTTFRPAEWLGSQPDVPDWTERPGPYTNPADAEIYLYRLELPQQTLQDLGLTAEGHVDPHPVRPPDPTNPYSPSYHEEVNRNRSHYENRLKAYLARKHHLQRVLDGRPITATDRVFWALGQLHHRRGTLQANLNSSFGLVLLDDFHAFTPLERAFLRRLLTGANVQVIASTEEHHAEAARSWLDALGRPSAERILRDRYVPLGHLLLGRTLDPMSTPRPARGGTGELRPSIHVARFAELKPHLQEQAAHSEQAGRTLAVLIPPKLDNRIASLVGAQQWDTEEQRPRAFREALLAALRYRLGLSDPKGGHPLLTQDWHIPDPDRARKLWLPDRTRAAIRAAWNAGRMDNPAARLRPWAVLTEQQERLDHCRSTAELAATVQNLQNLAPTPADEAWIAQTPDLFVALQQLTARTLVARPFLGVLGRTTGHWDDVVIILECKDADPLAVAQGVLRATRSLRFLTFGPTPPGPTHPATLPQTEPRHADLLRLLAQPTPPTPEELCRITGDPILRHYYETHWPDEVPDEWRDAWATAHGKPVTWPEGTPSRAWVTARSRLLLEEWPSGTTTPE